MGYIIGSVLFAVFVSKLKGIDITKSGSTNPGAANVTKNLGLFYGIMTGLLDCLKAAIPILLVKHFFITPDWAIILFAVSFTIGHNWSIFKKFNGGKGVGTSLGTIFTLFPLSIFICFPFFITVFLIKKDSTIAGLILFFLLPIVTFFMYNNTMFIIALLLFIIFIIRRLTHNNNYTLRALINKLIFDNDRMS